MSLRPNTCAEVPPSTAAVARAAFPRGNPYLRLRDALGTVFSDAQFAPLFPSRGQPAETPWRLALVTVLQFAENLSDRRAAEAVRGRIDWKYLLGLELTDPGFDASVLSEFRSRLVTGGAEALLLDTLLALCREHKLLVAGGRQRTDSTHVLGAVRALNRLALQLRFQWGPDSLGHSDREIMDGRRIGRSDARAVGLIAARHQRTHQAPVPASPHGGFRRSVPRCPPWA